MSSLEHRRQMPRRQNVPRYLYGARLVVLLYSLLLLIEFIGRGGGVSLVLTILMQRWALRPFKT